MSVVAPWMPLALGELDVTEVPGPRANPRIVDYHAATTLKATSDEVPWCASFVGFILRAAGLGSTGSAAARSYETWGVPTTERYGAVAVLSRGAPPAGHVGFIVDADDRRVWLLGGNQGDAVCIRPFPKARLVACRWPGQGGP